MSTGKIRVGSVSYLNAKPLIFGFEQGLMSDEVELLTSYPSSIASQLLENKIDVGLVPVAIIPQMPEHHIIGQYCIGSVGEVASVCLFSDVPLEEIRTVVLDYQSRTSVELLRILMREHWKIDPFIIVGQKGYENSIGGQTAGLVIGDRAFEQKIRSLYAFDLGTAWQEMTGLPFMFAAWISNKPLDPAFIAAFDKANAFGFENLELIVSGQYCPYFNLMDYYTRFISYRIDEAKMNGLNRFLSLLPPVHMDTTH